jgi:archaellum biogenesis ATPase FlaH
LQKKSKILTGFPFFDQKWGGAYSGGNYFIFGSQKSGKTILALGIIEHLVQSNFNTLLLTSERKKNLEIQASSVYFDIEEAISGGVLKVEKINSALVNLGNIKDIIREKNPSVLVIDELIDENLDSVIENYIEFIEFLEDSDITSFFLASVPSDEKTKQFVRKIAKNSTAIIQLQKTSSKRNYSGVVTLKPNIGHFEGEFETTFKVEPVKGFITLADNESSIYNMLSKADNSALLELTQDFEYTNIYNIEEFKFLVDSKISLSNQTGNKINMISYEVLNNSVEPVELCNAMRVKLDKGDKICFTDNRVYILPEKNDTPTVQKLGNSIDEKISKLFNNHEDLEKALRKTVQFLKPNFKII